MPQIVRFDPTVNSVQAQVISDVTPFEDGLMTPAMLAELDIVTAVDVVLYLSPTGSDSNDGLTPATALLTPEAAWLAMTSTSRTGKGQIICAPGSYTFSNDAGGGSFANASNLRGNASPLSFIGAFTNEVGTRTTTAASANGSVLTDSTLAMTVDEYKGLFVLCTSGANAGLRAGIKTNSATIVTLQIPFPSPISIGDQFQIQQPSVLFNVPDDDAAIFGVNNNYLLLQGINISCGANGFVAVVDDCKVVVDGVIFDMNFGFLLIVQNAFIKSADNGPWTSEGAANPITSGTSAGALFRNAFIAYGAGGYIFNNHAFNGSVLIQANVGGGLVLTNPNCLNSSIDLEACFSTIFDGTNGVSPGTFDGPDSFGVLMNAVAADTTAKGAIGGFSAINMPGPVVALSQMSQLVVGSVTGSTGNTDVGLQVAGMSQINQGSPNTVTGSAGDTRVNATIKAYGALPYTDGATLCRIE